MMGILYLVLLGIAATTVTDHVLDAFRNLTESLETSTKNVQMTVNSSFSTFEATLMKSDPVRAKPIYERAKKVREYADSLNNYINEAKLGLIKEGGGFEDNGEIKGGPDVDISPRVMIRKGGAAKLKEQIVDTRSKILALLDKKEQEGLKLALNAQDPPKSKGRLQTTWEDDNFGDGIPLIAAVTAFTKIQADLKNTENEVVRKILGEANEVEIVNDKFQAVAIPKSTYVLDGQQYQASVFLTSYSSTSNPDIQVGGQKLNIVDGKGMYTATASGEGERKWKAVVRVKKTDGSISEFTTEEQSYTVSPPSASVSPDKMLVFYIGVDNPVTIAAPGFPKDKVHPSISSGEIKGSNGKYIVNVKTRGTVKVTVTGEQEKGKSTVLGSYEFRVKPIPPPHVNFANKGGGRLSAPAMKSQNRIFAKLDDFEFDAKFNINHFTMFISKPRSDIQKYESNSNAFTPEMTAAMNGIIPGSRVVFDFVFATGPDGVKRSLDPIIFTVE